jgi:hypothetical protein
LRPLGALFGMAEVRQRIHVDLAQQGDIFLVLYFGVFLSDTHPRPVRPRKSGHTLRSVDSTSTLTRRFKPAA